MIKKRIVFDALFLFKRVKKGKKKLYDCKGYRGICDMNTSGMLRGYLAKVMDQESFFFHVINCMEKQLIDWGNDPMLLFNWEKQSEDVGGFFIIDGFSYSFVLTKQTLKKLQMQSPYALDRLIWESLIEGGFILKESSYIDKAFM